MEATATSERDSHDWAVKVYGAVAIVIAGFALLLFLVLVPWANERDAREARHNAEKLTAIHQAGFPAVTDDKLYNGAFNQEYFVYQVGSCNMLIYVSSRSGSYTPYIGLKGVEGANINVTYDKLRSLPQTKVCFIK